MKAQLIKKYLSRSLVSVLCLTLVTSCAYDNGYSSTYGSTSHRSSNDPTVPLLIGAAAIGAIALAKRHNDKKRYKHYDHNRGHYNKYSYGQRKHNTYPHRSKHRGYSHHRSHSNHGHYKSHHRGHGRNNLITTTRHKYSHGFKKTHSPCKHYAY